MTEKRKVVAKEDSKDSKDSRTVFTVVGEYTDKEGSKWLWLDYGYGPSTYDSEAFKTYVPPQPKVGELWQNLEDDLSDRYLWRVIGVDEENSRWFFVNDARIDWADSFIDNGFSFSSATVYVRKLPETEYTRYATAPKL